VIRSMTGFGSASAETDEVQARATVRSLNHRFLDVSLRLGRGLEALEVEIAKLVQARCRRGRIEVSLQATSKGQEAETVSVHSALAGGLVRALRQLGSEHGLEGGVRASDVIRFPGVLEVQDAPALLDGEARAEILRTVERALDGAVAMRRAEGEVLARDIGALLAEIARAASRMESLSEEGRARRKASLLEKVTELREAALDETRYTQEIVRLVDRQDVSEEVQRLRSHVELAAGCLTSDEPSGKRLDFVAQEMMREANTAASKAASADLVHEVVDLKGLVERLREQVQNAE
jgi:uncharacterized protein (TIGR00255 family)